MEISLLKQTRKNNCGQTAVAMLTGRSVQEAERVYGHGGITYEPQHIKAVNDLGFYADPRGFINYNGKLPELALVRLRWLKRTRAGYSTSGKTKKTGHLVLWANGRIYDPKGASYPLEELEKGAVIHATLQVLAP